MGFAMTFPCRYIVHFDPIHTHNPSHTLAALLN